MKQNFGPEVRIRDLYAHELKSQRPLERLLATEARFAESQLRADMRTIDRLSVVREWEFKLHADYCALGQVLTYLALSRQSSGDHGLVRAVLAAFSFDKEIAIANERLNLNIELVLIPNWMRNAGEVPLCVYPASKLISIPKLNRAQ
jgi:hypothetical protein